MSWEVSSRYHECDHLQILERYVIDFKDFRTLHYKPNPSLNMRGAINAPSMVRLYFKGVLVNPSHPTYGYQVVADPNRIQGAYPYQKIVFNQPIRELNALVEVTYLTRKEFCLKCSGTGKTLDWTVSPAGSLNRVTGVQKLAQQAIKYILTSRNPFNPNLTSPLRSYLNQKTAIMLSDPDISTAVTQVLSRYQSIQKAQSTVQTLDPLEMIRDVDWVSVTQDADDPTVTRVGVSITPYGSTEAIPLNIALRTS